jgi:hypothetical protein
MPNSADSKIGLLPMDRGISVQYSTINPDADKGKDWTIAHVGREGNGSSLPSPPRAGADLTRLSRLLAHIQVG